MWVLEARENAEQVWYPVVWEEVKDPSYIIDYNIRDEQTIDQSSVFNANNDTTTGMANVIPWINAPKLLADTSIYWISKDEWDLSYVVAVATVASNYTEVEMQPNYWAITISETWWDWIEKSWVNFKFNKDWVFYLDIRQVIVRTTVASWYYVRTIVNKNWTQFLTARIAYWPTWFVWTWPISVSKWDTISIRWCIWSDWLWYAPWWEWPSRNISITEMR